MKNYLILFLLGSLSLNLFATSANNLIRPFNGESIKLSSGDKTVHLNLDFSELKKHLSIVRISGNGLSIIQNKIYIEVDGTLIELGNLNPQSFHTTPTPPDRLDPEVTTFKSLTALKLTLHHYQKAYSNPSLDFGFGCAGAGGGISLEWTQIPAKVQATIETPNGTKFCLNEDREDGPYLSLGECD